MYIRISLLDIFNTVGGIQAHDMDYILKWDKNV